MKIFMLALAAATMLPHTVVAQPADRDDQAIDAHADLYAAILEGVDVDAIIDNLVSAFAEAIAGSDPELAMLEAENPGLTRAMSEAIRPTLVSYSERVRREYAPRMVAVLRECMTAEEAAKIAAFYRSETGMNVLRLVSTQSDLRAVISDSIAERDISSESVHQDANRTASRAMLAMTDEERARLFAAAAGVPALAKMNEFNLRSLPLRTEMQNAPLTEQESSEMERAVEAVFASYFPND